MILRSFGEYILRDNKQAAGAALLCSLLPLLVPGGYLFGWLGYAILGLVTLRKGMLDGFWVLLWLALPSVALAALGNPLALLYEVIFSGVLIWLLASILSRTASWRQVLYAASLLAALIIVTLYLLLPDLVDKWEAFLKVYLLELSNQFQLNQEKADVTRAAQFIAQGATGLQAVALLTNNLVNLALARWWQALLFNPGGFRQEFYSLRLDYLALSGLGLVLLGAVLRVPAALDIALVCSLPFILAGVSLVHSLLASKTKVNWLWLSLFYSTVILFFPYTLGLLIIVACADIKYNFRKKFAVTRHFLF